MSEKKKRKLFNITYCNYTALFVTCTNSSFYWLVAAQPHPQQTH